MIAYAFDQLLTIPEIEADDPDLAATEEWARFTAKAQPGDEVRFYRWEGGPRAGKQGFLLLRDGRVVAELLAPIPLEV